MAAFMELVRDKFQDSAPFKIVSILAEHYLRIEEGPSESTPKADYENELRELIRQRHGEDKIRELFPAHLQSHVLSRKEQP